MRPLLLLALLGPLACARPPHLITNGGVPPESNCALPGVRPQGMALQLVAPGAECNDAAVARLPEGAAVAFWSLEQAPLTGVAVAPLASARFADLSNGENSRALSSGDAASRLRSGNEMSGLVSGADKRGLGIGQGNRELANGSGAKELASGVGAKELASGAGAKELASGAGAKELASGAGAKELASGGDVAALASGAALKLPIELSKTADDDTDGHHATFHLKVRNIGTVTITAACVADHLRHVLDAASGGGWSFLESRGVSRVGLACIPMPLRPGEVVSLALPVSYPALSPE